MDKAKDGRLTVRAARQGAVRRVSARYIFSENLYNVNDRVSTPLDSGGTIAPRKAKKGAAMTERTTASRLDSEAGMSAKGNGMDLIDREELKEKLDRGDDFKLVMTLGEWEYRAKHIPGSLRVSTIKEAFEVLDPHAEIVLYDSGPHCAAGRMAYRILKAHGYERLRRYAGGLEEWESACYPLEGEQVFASSAA